VSPERCRLRVEDILAAVSRISSYLSGMEAEAFYRDQRTIDAVTAVTDLPRLVDSLRRLLARPHGVD
jgi:uncharacterized protein with HEPN domain